MLLGGGENLTLMILIRHVQFLSTITIWWCTHETPSLCLILATSLLFNIHLSAINSLSVLGICYILPGTWFNAHFGNSNNILKTIGKCRITKIGGYTMKRINSDPILSLWSFRSLLERQSVVDVNSTIESYPPNTL